MNNTWYVLLNPAAGNGKSLSKWDALKSGLDKRNIPYRLTPSTYRGHITELASAAIQNGYTKFISIGGDGTHHELINGLMKDQTKTITPTVAILNAGTGNDWSRTHHIPSDIPTCTELIAEGRTIDHSAGLITYTLNNQQHQRYFMNVAGMALDGRVVEKFPEGLRRIPFLPGYLIAGLKQLAIYPAPEIQIAADDETFPGKFLTVHAGICKYSGGGMQFVPHADPKAGDLAISGVRKISIPRLLGNIHRLYLGSLLAHPKVISTRTMHLHVSSPDGTPIPIEADGEFLGYSPVTIKVIPDAFRLVVPNAGH